jgi:uncharacterized membrane protein
MLGEPSVVGSGSMMGWIETEYTWISVIFPENFFAISVALSSAFRECSDPSKGTRILWNKLDAPFTDNCCFS